MPGYLPEAVINYLALLGWGYDETTTFFTHRRSCRSASRSSASPRPRRSSTSRSCAGSTAATCASCRVEDLTRAPGGASPAAPGCATRWRSRRTRSRRSTSSGRWPARSSTVRSTTRKAREKVLGAPEAPRRARATRAARWRELPEPWTAEDVEAALRGVVERTGVKPKQIFQPLRVALTGTTVSPGIFETVALLGRDETLARVDDALEATGGMSGGRWRGLNHRSTRADTAQGGRPMTRPEPPDRSPSADDSLMTTAPRTALPQPAAGPRAAAPGDAAAVRRRRPLAQRGSRQAPDRRLRGARGLPGARRVAQPPARAGRRGAPLDRRRRARHRVRRRAGDRRHAARQRARLAAPRPGRVDRRRRRGALARGRPARSRPTPRPSSSSSAARRGTPPPSASACTPSPSSAPPTASPPPPATRTATACSSPRCCTTSASSCSCTPTRATRSRSTARRARPRSACTTSAASSASTTRWSAASSPAAGTCRKAVASAIERHHADDAQGDAAFVRLADMLAHYSQGSPVSSTELLRAARTVGFGPSELRAVLYDLPYPSQDRPRAVEPCPLSAPRARGPQAPRPGHGLQADRARALALHEHGAHAPAQHLRQARRRRPRAGRPARHRARLALGPGSREARRRSPTLVDR